MLWSTVCQGLKACGESYKVPSSGDLNVVFSHPSRVSARAEVALRERLAQREERISELKAALTAKSAQHDTLLRKTASSRQLHPQQSARSLASIPSSRQLQPGDRPYKHTGSAHAQHRHEESARSLAPISSSLSLAGTSSPTSLQRADRSVRHADSMNVQQHSQDTGGVHRRLAGNSSGQHPMRDSLHHSRLERDHDRNGGSDRCAADAATVDVEGSDADDVSGTRQSYRRSQSGTLIVRHAAQMVLWQTPSGPCLVKTAPMHVVPNT